MSEHEKWLDEVLPNHRRLTDSVVTILQSLLDSKSIDYLSVTGRTKNKKSALDKIKRKKYDDPSIKMTDLSGVRVIVYFESDIERVLKIVEEAFNVDKHNSLNQDQKLSVNQIGYRSVHSVCDIGKLREGLSENVGLNGLKFEIQIRTVLQHAWAELAHDSNYKFTEKLPPEIERTINLYAGMLEIADKGFSEIRKDIDKYKENVKFDFKSNNFNISIDTISLLEFMMKLDKNNKIPTKFLMKNRDYSGVINDLEQLGITTIKELENIIPKNYSHLINKAKRKYTIYGHLTNWMIIYDFKKYKDIIPSSVTIPKDIRDDIFKNVLTKTEYDEFCKLYKTHLSNDEVSFND
ncbi:GTP pyrophosphokinase family protein [Providencia huaxiensis]|uniref:GTP pyrophosphokinase n=1 Tax=Providencia TaxID=586 RepID=UPI0018E82D22|nr:MULTISPECIES: GTP pyrophosphokinase [Providencia]QQE95072.1 GTP pyrophosphokinase [Providencia rettgeri]QWJ93539.1 GTP pyrophosphokinase [Providencia rettgeri]